MQGKDSLSLDAHAHVAPSRSACDLADAGAVLACTLSLDEARGVARRRDPLVAWGVGCHPWLVEAQASFSRALFEELVERAGVVGEVGLDARWSKVSMDDQMRVFRTVLEVVQRSPRILSIHSFTATRRVLDELRRTPVAAPILHGWTGTADETREAVALGCSFSVHSAVARRSVFHTAVPPERILVESDQGWADPPAAIPCRVEWVEHLLSVQLKRPREEVRRLAWANLATIVQETGTRHLLPPELGALLDGPRRDPESPARLLTGSAPALHGRYTAARGDGVTKRDPVRALESLPNIGAEAAGRLREVGIATPEELARVGSVEAARLLARARPLDPPCRSLLSGLEGAIRGVRWHAIPREEREALWTAYCHVRGNGYAKP